MKKIVIFDLDGTLLNTLDSIAYCGNTILKKYGIDPLDINVYPAFIGHGADNLIKRLTEYVNLPSDVFESFRKEYLEFYKENGSYGVAPYENMPELLTALKQKDIKIGILSNKPEKIVKDCIKIYFDDVFDAVHGQVEGVPVKPDTTQFFGILNSFGLSAKESIYCGDSGVDIETGKNAGALTLGAAWGFYGDKPFEKADGILYSPLDLLKYI